MSKRNQDLQNSTTIPKMKMYTILAQVSNQSSPEILASLYSAQETLASLHSAHCFFIFFLSEITHPLLEKS